MREEAIILDASVLINLQGCGVAERILRVMPARGVVPDVTSREVVRQPVDQLVERGLIERVNLSAEAMVTFMQLVRADPPDDLDDGEAAAIALAEHSKSAIALDEKKARRIVRSRPSKLRVVSTVELFCLPEVASELGGELADAVYNALINSRMRVLPENVGWVLELLGARAENCPSLKRPRSG
jgi:predicted nucleic acid-binding protein